MKVAIVCDWLVGIGGAERVVLELHELYPDAPIYTSQYDPSKIDWFAGADVRTTWLQKLPKGLRKFLPALRAWSFSHLNLSDYDLVISASGAEAKGVKTSPGAVHISYIHSPTHYYWIRYDEYLKSPGFGRLDPLARLGLKLLIGPLRRWDYKAAQRPDYLIANSSHTQKMIRKFYGRESTVIHPPVDTKRFAEPTLSPAMRASTALGADEQRTEAYMKYGKGAAELATTRGAASIGRVPSPARQQDDTVHRRGFVTAGRQTPYKRMDLAVQACTELNLPLIVLGSGPDHKRLKRMAGKSITFLRGKSDEEVAHYFQTSRAFIFPGMEDFGIVAVEALAAGTPVIAYKAGGALDYIDDGKNGLFFEQQTVKSLLSALKKFESTTFNSSSVAKSAEKFSAETFHSAIRKFIDNHIQGVK